MSRTPSETVRFTDQHWFIRLWEIIPGAVTWTCLVAPVVLSLIEPVWVAYFIIAFDLYWMIKSFRLSINLIRSYGRLRHNQRVNWRERLTWLKDPTTFLAQTEAELVNMRKQHPQLATLWGSRGTSVAQRYQTLLDNRKSQLEIVDHERTLLSPDKIYHAVILATYNESIDILEPSVKALCDVDFPLEQIMLVIAYEERGGAETESNAQQLIKQYGERFAMAIAVKHPDGIPGEVRGKGGNITFAGRRLTEEVRARNIHPEQVVVTTFDSDHRASKNYFAYLSYVYALDPNRVRKSFQPIPMFYNNIWDAPAPMRVIATGNTFWQLMEMMRPHRLRNFAAHAQSLAALIVTDYWSVTTIVEDGHQFWRTYFAYDGDHEVVPIFTPIFQDAVLADTYPKTIRAQFLQQRRWAWGVSDVQYVVRGDITHPQIPLGNRLIQFGRLFESHFSWATAPLILGFVAYLPLYLNHQFSYQTLAHELPIITSRIMTLSSVTIIVTALISVISLPPRPARYHRSRNIFMLAQWLLLPITSIFFGSFAALNAQTRLMFGRYLEFYTTDKATKR